MGSRQRYHVKISCVAFRDVCASVECRRSPPSLVFHQARKRHKLLVHWFQDDACRRSSCDRRGATTSVGYTKKQPVLRAVMAEDGRICIYYRDNISDEHQASCLSIPSMTRIPAGLCDDSSDCSKFRYTRRKFVKVDLLRENIVDATKGVITDRRY